jgi:4-hydroxythreonine-4-phosphate dehydrogenase
VNTKLPVGITMGDAAGIGPEIVVQACAQGLRAPHVVYGDAGALRRAAAALGARLDVVEIATPAQASLRAGLIEVIGRGPALPADLPPGQLSAQAGRGAYDYVCAAIDDAQAGAIRAIVTAPLNKHSMHLAGIDYPGHTEILAERSGTTDFAMMLANDELRVLLVTIHVALADVIARITPQAELSALRLADRACRQMGIARPRVAVAGLNPHAGEGGKFGREEIEIIEPAIAQARAEGINASGPWPGDTIFMRARRGEFDIVVAQYHDQGLIPVKYLGLDHGVNVTVGLPFVRTSVDHGTAFDIAGKGVADHASLVAAFDLALAMTP